MVISLSLNGTLVHGREDQTILEIARENDIDIPTLCYLENTPPVGACRLCVVEVEGSRTLVGSCHTPIVEGMVIQTHSPKVIAARRMILELLLASHPDACLVCDAANICELRRIATDLEIGLPRINLRKRFFATEEANPNLLRDMSKCILCRRCVSACRHIKGERLFSVAYRGFESKVVYHFDEPLDKDACRDCDTCIEVCPTGALSHPRRAGERKRGKPLVVKGK